MHRVIIGAKPGEKVDHKNGDGLNNLMSNLRITTQAGNQRGFAKIRSSNTSGFRGVSLNKLTQKFRAYLCHDGLLITVGFFPYREDAARARDAKARELGWPEEGMNFPQ
jgi:hypothetical protein